ncbi:hypothetical protein LTR17_021734, partial [Elasticomyces elasticus]
MQQADLQEEAASEPRVDTREESGLTADTTHATSPDMQEEEAPKSVVKTKKKKAKARSKACLSKTTFPTQNLLATYARVYAAAAKDKIPPLMDAALEKFRSESEGIWESRDVITAIPIVYGHTSEIHTKIRGTLRALILDNAHDLVSENHFREAIEKVEGLPFDLFGQLSSLARYWRV